MTIFAKIGIGAAALLLVVLGWVSVGSRSYPAPVSLQQLPTEMASSSTPVGSPTSPANPQPGPMQPPSTAVSLESVNPSSAAVGDTVVLYGSGFTSDNTVLFGGNTAASHVTLSSFTNGHQTITFTIPSALAPNCPAGHPCPMYMRLLTAGNYEVTVQNSNGTSNELTLTVTGGMNLSL